MEDALVRLQRWYLSQCDGDWEHQYGVTIDTLDNPGWRVRVDLTGTRLEGRTLPVTQQERTETDWVAWGVENGIYTAHGGPLNLTEMIEGSLAFAEGA